MTLFRLLDNLELPRPAALEQGPVSDGRKVIHNASSEESRVVRHNARKNVTGSLILLWGGRAGNPRPAERAVRQAPEDM